MAAVLLSGSPGLAAPAATLPAADKQYVLRYGDSINLYVVENEKLAIQNQPIRPDGRVSMPLIGEVIAGGLTLPQLTERVAKSYTKFFVDPHVVVNVATFRALSVSVIGRVTHPGVFKIQEPVSILQAIALAGGLDPYRSDTSNVLVLRANGERRIINLAKVLEGKVEDNLLVADGDTVQIAEVDSIDWYRASPLISVLANLATTASVIFFGLRK